MPNSLPQVPSLKRPMLTLHSTDSLLASATEAPFQIVGGTSVVSVSYPFATPVP